MMNTPSVNTTVAARTWRLAALTALLAGAAGAQQPPKLEITPPQGDLKVICLDGAPTTVTVENGSLIYRATAAQSDFGCPAENSIDIVDFGVAADAQTPGAQSIDFDTMAASNCDINNGEFTQCLYFNWETTGINLVNPRCRIDSTNIAVVNPDEINNGLDIANGPAEKLFPFVKVRDNSNKYLWPLDSAMLPGGNETVTFTMSCFVNGGTFTDSAAVDVCLTPDGSSCASAPSAPQLTGLTLSASSVAQGQTFNADWTINMNGASGTQCNFTSAAGVLVDPGAVNLDANGNFSGTGLKRITLQVQSTAPTGTQTITMSCDSGSTQASANIDVTSQSSVDCSNNQPPAGTTRDMDFTSFETLFGMPWPGPNGNTSNVTIDRDKFAALAFTSGSPLPASGELDTANVGNTDSALISISRCPGDFNVSNDCSEPNSFDLSQPSLKWHMAGTAGGTNSCELQTNTDYFLNIIHAKVADPSELTCSEQFCTKGITPRF